MKRKISIILLLFTLITQNVQASIIDSLIYVFSAKPAFEETQTASRIYDDTQNHWCNYSAERLYNEGIFKGIQIGDKSYFMPDVYITRGEFLLYLNTLLQKDTSSSVTLPFADASSIPVWQLPTVSAMYKAGIIHGNTEKQKLYFNHDEKISRLDCAIILNNMLNIKNNDSKADFYDSYLIPKYAVGAVKNVTDYGLMNGFEDQSFRPYIKITRGMLAEILCNVKDYIESKSK